MKTYFTGKPCKHGHIAERRLSNKNCCECARIDALKRHHRNREKNIKRMKAYGKTDKEKLRQKIYREENRSERLRLCSVWYSKNKDRARKYREDRKERYAAHTENRRARLEKAEGSYNDQDIFRILRLQNNKCAECKKLLESYHVDHIHPISKGGSNWPKNLQILCAHCNYSKNATLPLEWARLNGRLL